MKAMFHHKYPPSTDLWLCKHGVGYPDICEECKNDAQSRAATEEATVGAADE
jgi:hypothetical protein